MEEFGRGREGGVGDKLSGTEAKEFTYWLFKYRLANHDKAKVASDTKRGLQYLNRKAAKRMAARAASGAGS